MLKTKKITDKGVFVGLKNFFKSAFSIIYEPQFIKRHFKGKASYKGYIPEDVKLGDKLTLTLNGKIEEQLLKNEKVETKWKKS